MKSFSLFLSLAVLISFCSAGKIFAGSEDKYPPQLNPGHVMTKEGNNGSPHRYYYFPLNNPPFSNIPGTSEDKYGYVSRVIWNQKNQTHTFYLVPPDPSQGYLEVVFDKSGKILSSYRVREGRMFASKESRDEFKHDAALQNYLQSLWTKNIGLVSRAMTPEEAKNPSENYLVWSPLMGGMNPPPSDESLGGPPERSMRSEPSRSGLPLYQSLGMIPPPDPFNQKTPQGLPLEATSPVPSNKPLRSDESIEGPPERSMRSEPFRAGLPLYQSPGMIPPPAKSGSTFMRGDFSQKTPQSLPPEASSP
jgi:hypothetical protein